MKLDAATIDRLREIGATDDMLKWLEHPEAVRTLVSNPIESGYDPICSECNEDVGAAHLADCSVAAALRALGDERGARDIVCAEEEAYAEDERRQREASLAYAPQGPATIESMNDAFKRIYGPLYQFGDSK